MQSIYIALRYLAHYKVRATILIACVTVIAVLPLALEVVRAESQKHLMTRAIATPLVVGARGSAMDLVMNSLYFTRDFPQRVSMQLLDDIEDSGLVTGIPLYVRFAAQQHPIVGTSVDYFEFRQLTPMSGRIFAQLGECVLGAEAARVLGLGAGDSLLSSPESVFDLTGAYPLKMRVVGVLAPSQSPDDNAVFVDVKTAWVIRGLVHGHQDVERTRDPTLVMQRDGKATVATAKLYQFNEITPDNVDSFHFHGDPVNYPLTAVLALPFDDKSETLFRGRYLQSDSAHWAIQPRDTVGQLLENIFRVKRLLQGVLGIVGATTLLALVLVFALSLRLRNRELQTLFRLGAARGTVVRLVLAEIGIIAAISALLCSGALWVISVYSTELLRLLVLSA